MGNSSHSIKNAIVILHFAICCEESTVSELIALHTFSYHHIQRIHPFHSSLDVSITNQLFSCFSTIQKRSWLEQGEQNSKETLNAIQQLLSSADVSIVCTFFLYYLQNILLLQIICSIACLETSWHPASTAASHRVFS